MVIGKTYWVMREAAQYEWLGRSETNGSMGVGGGNWAHGTDTIQMCLEGIGSVPRGGICLMGFRRMVQG